MANPAVQQTPLDTMTTLRTAEELATRLVEDKKTPSATAVRQLALLLAHLAPIVRAQEERIRELEASRG